MSTNKTPHYRLHSWVGTDDFLMAEMNDNFAAIDAALKGQTDALAEKDAELRAHALAAATAAEAAAKAASRPSTWTPTAADVGASATGHKHAAGDVTSGTLAVARGGTGQTTLSAAGSAMMNALTANTATPNDTDYFISEKVGGGTVYYRRPLSSLWTWIAGKVRSVFGFSASNVLPVANGGTGAATAAAALSALGGTSVVFGAYTGTGSSAGDQAIALGFRPKLVIVMRKDGRIGGSDWGYLAMAGDGFPMGTDVRTGLEITAAGFIAGQSRPNTTSLYCDVNVLNAVYYYAAFK